MSDFLPDPSTKHMRAQSGVVDSSAANAVSGLASAVGQLGQRLGVKREERRVEQANVAIGAATTGLLDLEDSRSQLILDEQAAVQATSSIYEDGVVSPEEQAQLDSMKGELDRLDAARKTGLLNPTSYSMRRNAMHKQALADVSHLNIQSNINSLFGSNVAAGGPTQSPVEAKLNQTLDAQYGVGAWGAREKAQFVGNQVFVAQKMNDASARISALDGQVHNLSTAINGGALTALLSSVSKKGGLVDTDRDMYMSSVIGQFNAMEAQLEDRIAEGRANGEPLDQDEISRLRSDLAAERQYYTADIFKEDLANTDILARMEKSQKIRQAMVQANAPAGAQAALSLSMGGVGGKGGQDLLLAIMDPATNLEALIPADSPVSAEQMRASAQEALTYLLTADYSIQQQMDDGVISAALGTFMTNGMVKKVDPKESPEANTAFNDSISGFEVSSVNLSDNDEFTESIRAFSQHANKIGTKGDAEAAKRAREVLRAQQKRVADYVKGTTSLSVSIGDDGLAVVTGEGVRSGLAGRAAAGKEAQAREMVDALNASYLAYNRAGVADLADLSELSTAEELPEATPLEPTQRERVSGTVLTSEQLDKKLAEEGSSLPPLEGVEDGVYELEDGTQFTVVGGKIQ